MRKASERIAAFAAAVMLLMVLVFGTSLTAYADISGDYRIYDTYWNVTDGHIVSSWEKAESSTSYKVQLYKGGISESKKVGSPYTTSSSRKEWTAAIADKGTGTYYFTVYPVKGGVVYMMTSEGLDVDSAMVNRARQLKLEAAAAPVSGTTFDGKTIGAGTPVWDHNPDGSWTYYQADGTVTRACFADIGGHRYCFDANGCTLYGWQFISSRWYYFEPKGNGSWPQGAMWRNATTPDGYTVNENGEWTINGAVQTSKNAAANVTITASGTAAIKNCTISLKSDTASGTIPKPIPSSATNCRVAGYSYSVPYESWEPGSQVDMNVQLEANAGYEFASNVAFSCSGATPITYSGSNTVKTVVLRFTPSAQLAAPSGLYVYQNDYTVHWDKVKGAGRYRVKVYSGGSQVKSVITTETYYDVSEFIDEADFNSQVNVKITALGPEGNNSLKESPAAEISDVKTYAEQRGVSNDFNKEGKTVTYSKTGWQKVGGSWYYFNQSGEALGGWFKDSNSNYWYYLDPSSKRMLTGYVYVDGVRYFLNDGSVSGVPEGAWIEGR